MADESWNVDRFVCELAALLTGTLAGGGDAAALARGVTESAAAAEAVCTGRPMACAAGCPHCCVLNVAILLPEGMIMAEWLRDRLPAPELAAVRERLALHRSWTRYMDDEERILKHAVCPMLDQEGLCIVHPVRPLACRAVTSLDSAICREAFAPIVNDEAPLVITDLLRQAAYDAAFTELARSLRACGLDDRSIDLGVGVLTFLERPEYRELLLKGGKLPGELWL
jgi:Fe-S-cluster containining protein